MGEGLSEGGAVCVRRGCVGDGLSEGEAACGRGCV